LQQTPNKNLSEDLIKKPTAKEISFRLLKYLRPYKSKFSLALVAMVFYGATDGIVPYILKRILDDVFGSKNPQMLYYLIVFIVIFAAFRGFFGFVQKYLSAQVGLNVVRDIRNDITNKLLTLHSSFYQDNTTGNLITRVTNDTLLVRTALTDSAAAVLRDTVRIIALLVAAFYLDPVLASIAFIGLPLCFFPIIKFGKKIRSLSRSGQDSLGGLTAILQEIILGQKVIQSFSRENFENQRFMAENQEFTSLNKKAEKYSAVTGPINEFIASMAIAGVLLYGGHSVIHGTRTQGDFIAFLTSMFLLYDPIKKTGRLNSIFQTGISAAERIFEIIDIRPHIEDAKNAETLELPISFVEFENVDFSYGAEKSNTSENTTAKNILNQISFKAKAGQTIALVGSSGGGKSTMVNLLPRFFDPIKGEVRINNKSIKNYTLESLRSNISMVGQNTFLFNDTIYNNIAYGMPNASKEDVISAAKAANADTFITQLSDSYNTSLDEQGMNLSGGQRARLAIARAILKSAPILILDEATASLDSESEGLVQEAISRLMQNKTVFVIAHRLSTIVEADLILVISKGEIVEQGTHQELLALNGEYSKLYRLQFKQEAIVNS